MCALPLSIRAPLAVNLLSSKGFSGFLFLSNPSLLVFLGFSICFLYIFFVSRHVQNDEKGSFCRKLDLGLLRVQNRQNLAKICITSTTTSASQHCSAEFLTYWHYYTMRLVLRHPWLALHRQLAAHFFSAFVNSALSPMVFVPISISRSYTCKTSILAKNML